MPIHYTMMNYTWLISCCLGAGIIAAILSSNRCLWLDELLMLITARRPFIEGLLQLEDYSAPMYQIILRFIVHNEFPSEWVVRAPAFLFALFGLVSTWWLAKTLFSSRVATLTVFIVAFNPFFLRYAVEARPYSLFLFLSVMSIGTYYKFILYNSSYYLFLYVLSTALLVYSHYFGFLILPAEALFFFLYMISRRESYDMKKMVFAFSVIGLLSLPALWLISRYVLTGLPGTAGWISKPNLKDLIFVNVGGRLFGDRTFSILCLWAFIVMVLTIFSSLKKNEASKESLQKTNFESWQSCYLSPLLCFLWIGSSYCTLVVISFIKPILIVRSVLPVMVPCAILLSAVTCKMTRSVQMLVLTFIVAAYIPQIKTQLAEVRTDYPDLVAQIRQSNYDKNIVYVAGCADYKYYKSALEAGLRYYGYNKPNIAALKLSCREDLKSFIIQEPRLLQTDNRFFVATHWERYEKLVDECLERSSREYRKLKYGMLTLFEVNK